MKQVPIILGYRNNCYRCGASTRMILFPTVNTSKWQLCEDFDGTPEVIELHDCPVKRRENGHAGARRAETEATA